MKVIDTVKEEPRTELEVFERWCNYLSGKTISTLGKKIEVRQIEKLDPIECPPNSRGRHICERNGEHSWFSHAMDKAY